MAELIGIMFKTHKDLCAGLVADLFDRVLPAALNSNEKNKQKFALFVMDDMIEFLGPAYLG